MFKSSSNNTVILEGVAKIKAVNSPQYINKLAREAYSILDCPEAVEIALDIITKKGDKNQIFLTPFIKDKVSNFFRKYYLTGGVAVEFLDCKVEFKIKDKMHIINDALAEITIKDGIVTKIEKVNLKREFNKDASYLLEANKRMNELLEEFKEFDFKKMAFEKIKKAQEMRPENQPKENTFETEMKDMPEAGFEGFDFDMFKS